METKQQQEFDQLLIEAAKKHMDVFELRGFKRTYPSLYKTMLAATEAYAELLKIEQDKLMNKTLSLERLKFQDWISIDERLPDKEGATLSYRVLTLQEGGDIEVSHYDYKFNKWVLPPHHSKITHWQELPTK